MGLSPGGRGFLRVVTPAERDQQDRDEATRRGSSRRRATEQADIASFIRQQWMVFRNHRNLGANPLNMRLLRAQRMFEGKYDPEKLAQIQQFGGSEVYARLVAGKSRGATSLLRDVYLGPQRAWDIEPQPDPPIPPEIRQSIMQLVQSEAQNNATSGQPIEQDQVRMRITSLLHAAQQAARRNAIDQAQSAADKMDDILNDGGFYEAFGEFLLDLPLFPYAVIKGPIVRIVPKLVWQGSTPAFVNKPQMFWERVNPFQIYWSPGASSLANADVIERHRYTRKDLNDLIGLPGYNEAAVRGALEDYANGLREWLDAPDPEQAINEGREDPNLNRSQFIEGIEYHGMMQGRFLLEQGVARKQIPDFDADRDYLVQSWVVGAHTLKTQINPSPRQRHPYYVTSFEKVPGTVAGHALPDILEDVQEVANAAYRSLVNNLAISSGPQVIINDEMIAPTEHGDELVPWKRWHTMGDPLGNQREPISFFQPQSNAQELLLVISNMQTMADEASGIPRYMTGESLSGGAGRTASGLGMLMNNAEKVAQIVAANIDTDVLEPCLQQLYDLIMLTDTSGMLTGQEEIRVKGSEAEIQRATAQQKRLQFLQITANPIDGPIIGEIGRARVLRAIAQDLDLPDDVVPDDQTLQSQIDAQKQLQAASAALQAHAEAQGATPPGMSPGQNASPGQGKGQPGQAAPKGIASPPGGGGGGPAIGGGMGMNMGGGGGGAPAIGGGGMGGGAPAGGFPGGP